MTLRLLWLVSPFLVVAANSPAEASSTANPYDVPTTTDARATPDAPPDRDKSTIPTSYFGQRGTLALGLSFDIGAANTGVSQRPLGLGVRPTLDVFLLDGLSIGVAAGFTQSAFDGSSFYTYGGEVRTGYALRLNDRFAIWPRLLVSYEVGGVPLPSGTGTLEDLRAGANVPLVFRLGGHLMFELGPIASTDLWRSVSGQPAARDNILGMRGGLTGWF
jgi:hypothetical protein